MKIGHFVSFGLGGADKNALNIVRAQKEQGVDVTVFYNDFSIPKIMPVHNNGYNPVSRQDQFSKITKIVKISNFLELHSHGLDLLHTHRSGEDVWLIPGFDKAKHPFKVVETNFHGNHSTYADGRAYPCKTLMDFKKIKASESSVVIANAINLPATEQNLRADFGLSEKIVFGRLARPDSDIYCHVNLQAYSKIETDETVFVYVAPHNLAKTEASRLGIKNIIWVDPQLDEIEVSKLYNTFDIFLHSNSVGETFGNTIAEAMMHKLPVISHTGNKSWPQAHIEFFEENKELILNGFDVDGYAKQMARLKNDHEERKRVGRVNQAIAKQKFSSENVAREYISFYKTILGTK